MAMDIQAEEFRQMEAKASQRQHQQNTMKECGQGPPADGDGAAVPQKEARRPINTSHSPSLSETSSFFSTTDCSSFSSRSDASSFAKEEATLVAPSSCASVTSSIEFMTSSAAVAAAAAVAAEFVGKHLIRDQGETSFLEFSFRKGRLMGDLDLAGLCTPPLKHSSCSSPCDGRGDAIDRFPVWTSRTRYCSEEVHSCINPCFEQTAAVTEPRSVPRSKKLAKSLGSVLSKHLALSPGPTFRRSSCERFSSRLGLDFPSPSPDKHFPAGTPSRRTSNCGTPISRTSRSSSNADRVYKISPKRGVEYRKSVGCLGSSFKSFPEEDGCESREPLYFASEESVHGGKNRCLPSPRLSFGKTPTTALRQDTAAEGTSSSSSVSMVVPSKRVQGQLHCILRGDLPSFTFLVDGLEEVFVAKAIRPGSPSSLDTGDLLYTFYSWKPRGRALKGSWKSWMRKDRSMPDFVGSLSVNSRVLPASTKDGDDSLELEFVLRKDSPSSCSPRLSFSTWETGSSTSYRSPSPALYGFPSPFCPMTPSPCRQPSSRYITMSMVPSKLASPLRAAGERQKSGRSRRSPMALRSDDERSVAPDGWTSDTELESSSEAKENLELAALIVRLPSGGNKLVTLAELNQKWESAKKKTAMKPPLSPAAALAKSSSYYRRLSLPGRFQSPESKENDTAEACNAACNSTEAAAAAAGSRSFKLRELMGVRPDFGKQEGSTAEADDETSVTVILPAGNHGIPRQGSVGPEPLVERWRSGGRCDCGSWDLGCGLNILESEQLQEQQEQAEINGGGRSLPGNKDSSNCCLRITSAAQEQLKSGGASKQVALTLEPIEDGLFAFSFQAPMSYLQAFATAVAVMYSRGPTTMAMPTTTKQQQQHSLLKGAAASSFSFRKASQPRFPLRPLAGQQQQQQQQHIKACAAAAEALSYCSPPSVTLLDRL